MDNSKRKDFTRVSRRVAKPGADPIPESSLPAISLPWVPMLINQAILDNRFPVNQPTVNEGRFLDCVHRLGGWTELQKEGKWRSLLRKASSSPQGWLRDGMRDFMNVDALPLRKAAMGVLAHHGYEPDNLPYWSMGHHLRLRVFVRNISEKKQDFTGKKKKWIGAAKLMPVVLAALRGVLWVSDDQVREIDIRVEPTQSPHYRDIWSVRVEECFVRDWPDWVIRAPEGEVYEGEG